MAIDVRKILSELKRKGSSGEQIAKVEQLLKEYEVAMQQLQKFDPAVQSLTADGSAFEMSKTFEEIAKLYSENAEVLGGSVQLSEEKFNLLEDEKEILKKIVDIEIAAGQLESEKKKIAQKRIREIIKRQKAEKDFVQGVAKGEQAAKLLLQASLGLSTEWNKLGTKGGMKGFAKGMVKGIKSLFNPIAILASVAQKVFQSALAQDKAAAGLFARTGIDRSRVDIRSISLKLKGMGVDLMGKTASSIASLQEGYRSFNDVVGKENFSDIVNTLTAFESMGASGQDVARTYGLLTKVFDKTPKQATAMMQNFTALAEESGRPVKELFSTFVNQSPILARFEKQGTKIFRDISLQAARMEMDVAKLLTFEESMDTYEGAAKVAQAFNVAFGKPMINAQELLAASHGEKMNILAKAMKESGINFSPRMLRGLAQDANIDVDMLQKMAKHGAIDMSKSKKKVENNQKTLASNIEKVAKNQTVMDKLLGKMQEIISHIAQSVGADKGLALAVELLRKVAITLFGNSGKELEAKALAEGGLVKASTVTASRNTSVATGKLQKSFLTVKEAKKEQEVARALLAIKEDIESGRLDVSKKGGFFDFGERGRIDKSVSERYKIPLSLAERLGRHGAKSFFQGSFSEKNLQGMLEQDFGQVVDMAALMKKYGKIDVEEEGGIRILQKDNTFVDDNLRDSQLPMTESEAAKKARIEAEKQKQNQSPPTVQPQNDAFVSPASVSSNFVQPVFHKQDKFYAAKEGGVIAKALDEVLAAVDKLIAQKSDVNLSIREAELARVVDRAMSANSRRGN